MRAEQRDKSSVSCHHASSEHQEEKQDALVGMGPRRAILPLVLLKISEKGKIEVTEEILLQTFWVFLSSSKK